MVKSSYRKASFLTLRLPVGPAFIMLLSEYNLGKVTGNLALHFRRLYNLSPVLYAKSSDLHSPRLRWD